MGGSRSARQAIPLLLVGILMLTTAAAAVVGATATHPAPTSFVQGSLSATTRAGSAEFTFALATKASGNPGGTSTGSGSINFAEGTSDIVMKMHSIESVTTPGNPTRQVPEAFTLQEIHTPRGTYQRPAFARVAISQPWVRIRHFPVPSGPLGLLSLTPIAVAITPLLATLPTVRWQPVGTATISGTPTTEYQRAPAVRTCTTTGPNGFVDRSSDRVSLWLDRSGRIRQIQTVSVTNERGGDQAPGDFTTLGTLTFTSFGHPVTITDPPVGGGGATSEGVAVSGRDLTTSCGP
jgi:hypothetical protein